MDNWITNKMPEEHDSKFVKYYDVLNQIPEYFYKKCSDIVLVTIAKDEERFTSVAKTTDGVWKLETFVPEDVNDLRVVAWAPLPEPYKV